MLCRAAWLRNRLLLRCGITMQKPALLGNYFDTDFIGGCRPNYRCACLLQAQEEIKKEIQCELFFPLINVHHLSIKVELNQFQNKFKTSHTQHYVPRNP